MFSEKGCLENLKHIVSEYADDKNIKNLSLDELRSSYAIIAENIYPVSVSNCLKYKNMLWNIENLKPEIRSKFQTELFNTWHSIYIKSIKTDSTEDPPEMIEHESTLLSEVGKSPGVDVKEQPSIITGQQAIDSKKQKSVASSKDKYLSHEMKPLEKHSPITVPIASVQKFENDWFDKILDFFAAIVSGVLGIVGR